MRRDRALKVVLVVVGLLFCAGVYPLILMVKQDPALAMMMSLYATLGIFLIMAARNPSANRSLIAFTAWSSFGTLLSWECAGITTLDRSQGTDWGGCARCHWGGTDRVGSGKTYETANRGGIGGCVGCSVALPASYPAAAPRLDPRLPTIPEK